MPHPPLRSPRSSLVMLEGASDAKPASGACKSAPHLWDTLLGPAYSLALFALYSCLLLRVFGNPKSI